MAQGEDRKAVAQDNAEEGGGGNGAQVARVARQRQDPHPCHDGEERVSQYEAPRRPERGGGRAL